MVGHWYIMLLAPKPARRPVFFTTADDIQREWRRARDRRMADDIDDETVCILAAAILN